MRRAFLTAIFAAAPTSLLAATFDLSLDDLNGERLVVVALADGDVFAVAAGGEDLKVLSGEEAERARAKLVGMEGEGLDGLERKDGEGKKKKKIVIHKMSIDEDDEEVRDEERRIVRVIKREHSERSEESLLKDDAEKLIEGETDGAVERRVIRMKGADEARAIKFIDDIKGLDIGEKAAMKAAVGL
jgi:hypothetical protein